MFIINPDRTWLEPWRFITYGLVHNTWIHLIGNILWQIMFGLPLELSNGSISVASVFLSGIFLGGLGRELNRFLFGIGKNVPLAGASGEISITRMLRILHDLTLIYIRKFGYKLM